MEALFIIVLFILFITIVLLPIMTHLSVSGMGEDLGLIRREVTRLRSDLEKMGMKERRPVLITEKPLSAPADRPVRPVPPSPPPERLERPKEEPVPTAVWKPAPLPPLPSSSPVAEKPKLRLDPVPKSESIPPSAPSAPLVPASSTRKDSGGGDSPDWFSRLSIWVGGIALLMAGFFMIKFSIDSGWLTPSRRVWFTGAFGLILCVASAWVSRRANDSTDRRMGQAIGGAGVACLYFATYAAVHLYGLTGPRSGFIFMVAVTLVAVFLSLRGGAPLAVMGLAGGFLTPWVMSTGSNDTVMLFSYLFVLLCGAYVVCVYKRWWGLLLASVLAAFVWSGAVLFSFAGGGLDAPEGAGLFVTGICLASVFTVWQAGRLEKHEGDYLLGLRLLTWGVGLVQMLVLVYLMDFAAVDLGLLTLLCLAAIGLGLWREQEFLWAPWAGLFAMVVVGFQLPYEPAWRWVFWPVGMFGLYALASFWRAMASNHPASWCSLSMLAGTILLTLKFINHELLSTDIETFVFSGYWLEFSCVLAVGFLLQAEVLGYRRKDMSLSEHWPSAFAIMAMVLLGFGLATILTLADVPMAFGGLLALVALLWGFRRYGHSQWVAGALAVAWALSSLPRVLLALAYFVGQPELEVLGTQDDAALLGWMAGIGGGLFAIGLLVPRWPKEVQTGFRMGWALATAIGLVAVYQWFDLRVFPDSWSSELRGSGLTAILALIALGVAWIKPREWNANLLLGLVLSILLCIRIALVHLAGQGATGDSFFFNALLFQFGIPFLAVAGLSLSVVDSDASESKDATLALVRIFYQSLAMILAVVWATFLVQDYFGGDTLWGPAETSTELYTYSVVWLLLAIAFQVIALRGSQKALHIGSLVMLLLTVAKVFLVDAAELRGLYRVMSFLGLGIVLIGIGYYYNKVVFRKKPGIQGTAHH